MEKFRNGENFEELGGDHGEMIGYFDDQYYYPITKLLCGVLYRCFAG